MVAVHHHGGMTTEQREVIEFSPEGGVVVGDDGSVHAADAVLAAAEEAALRGLALHVVRAWSITSVDWPEDTPRGVVPSLLELESATLEAQRSRVAALVPGVDAGVHVVHCPASKVLVHASRTADLLVIGIRGGGGFRHLLMGSVAEQVVRHAHCSVLVVRGEHCED